MRTVETKADLRAALADARRESLTVGLVPTMGALHAGHRSLLEAARRDCGVVVMSLFVNPAQFGPGEDLERYPRSLERDATTAAEAGVDLLYAPAVGEVYPEGFSTYVSVEGLTDVLCGDPSSRGAEHFRGVTTVVAKLLNTVGPDVLYVGQKDAQQAVVIRRMVVDLDFPTRVEVMPTVREADGLAMSSRNAYLDPGARERARSLRKALLAALNEAAPGRPTAPALEAARRVLADAEIEPEYLEARDAIALRPIETFNGAPVLLAVAAQVGGARLIDNVLIEPDRAGEASGTS